MLPQLSSEEAIRMVNITAVGSGNMEKDSRNEVISAWEKQARPRRRRPRRQATPEQLSAMGIGFRKVTPTRP